ncbi:hypothetical protein QL285_058534 [Trifolium repens]|nr:hypothetical protein QL285_058534 [Trifolium repens]
MSEITYGLPTPMPHVCNPVVLLILFLHGQIQFSRVRPPINTFASSTAVPYLDKTDFRRLQNDRSNLKFTSPRLSVLGLTRHSFVLCRKGALVGLKGVGVVYKLPFASSTKRCESILMYPEHKPPSRG